MRCSNLKLDSRNRWNPSVGPCVRQSRWWAHFESTRINIALTIVKKEFEETLSLQKCDGYLDLRAFQGEIVSARVVVLEERGRLNEVADLTPILTILDTLPAGSREARRTMLGSVVAESRRYPPSRKVMLARRVQQAVDLVLVSSTGSPVQRFTASPLHSPSR
jgi:hypothetical protein